MNLQSWIDWCSKQLSDLSVRLARQGYNPDRIDYLNSTSNIFRDRFAHHLDRINQIMEDIEANPAGYHHFDDFSKAKMELLRFTCEHRGNIREPELAKTA